VKSGFVALVGLPNAGKSTLMNRLAGERLAIVSSRAQTTRDRVYAIVTRGDAQMIFVDTPGLLEPRDELHQRMRAAARRAITDADVVVTVTDATDRGGALPDAVADAVAGARTPLITVRTKSDLLIAPAAEAARAASPDALLVSALTGDGIDALLARVMSVLPEGPFLYPDDEIATQPTRFFAAEFVREAAFEQLGDEIPYAVACEIEEFREDRSPMYIRATLYVERDSQKRILIGAKGTRIRALGTAARTRIEALVGAPVYLDLWVKVAPHWRREPNTLDRLGYRLPE